MRSWRRCRWCGTGSTASGNRPSGRSPRPLGVVPRLLGVTGLLAWQLAVAVPAQARAGDLDPGFGVGGKVVTDIAGQLDEALAVAVQANGKLVAAGLAAESDVSGLGDFALVRYRADGRLDPGFGAGGSPNNSFGFGSDFGLARCLAG
jgi:uncharacterized delta-60 repeat protein